MHSPDNPLVTLILLAYKQEQFIREAVEGAFAQTYSPLEIIISDDASPDRTFEIIQEMAAAYQGPHRIILNRNEKNLGIGAHVNKCFQLSSGEWIVGAAGDDVSEPERVAALMVGVRDVKSAVAAMSAWIKIDAQGNPLTTPLPPRLHAGAIHRYGEYDWVGGFIKKGDTGTPGVSAMWKRSLFTDFPVMGDGIMAEDAVLGFRAYLTGSVVFLSQTLVQYRTHADNVCGFSGGDEGWMNDRRVQFSRNVRASVEMNQSDYRHYLARNPEIHEDPRIHDLIQYSLRVNALESGWWDHGLFWRLRGLTFLARTGGIRKLKPFLPKLISKSIYVWLTKVRRSWVNRSI